MGRTEAVCVVDLGRFIGVLGKIACHCDHLVLQRRFVESSAHTQPVLVLLLGAVSGHKASAIERAAAQWRWGSRAGCRCLRLHYDLVALHETLANELFKHLLGRHLYTLLVPPVNVRFWEEIITALLEVVLQALAVGEVVGGEGEARRSSERLPVHSHCATEAWHWVWRRRNTVLYRILILGPRIHTYGKTKTGCFYEVHSAKKFWPVMVEKAQKL